MATLEDLEARIAAVEASHADYRAVLAAVNALGANQREHSLRLVTVESKLGTVESELGTVKSELADFRLETRATLHSVDEQLAEIRDLIVGQNNN